MGKAINSFYSDIKKVSWVVTTGIVVLFCVKFLKSNFDSVEVVIISVLLCLLYVFSVFLFISSKYKDSH